MGLSRKPHPGVPAGGPVEHGPKPMAKNKLSFGQMSQEYGDRSYQVYSYFTFKYTNIMTDIYILSRSSERHGRLNRRRLLSDLPGAELRGASLLYLGTRTPRTQDLDRRRARSRGSASRGLGGRGTGPFCRRRRTFSCYALSSRRPTFSFLKH